MRRLSARTAVATACAALLAPAFLEAQTAARPPLVGPARDLARSMLVDPLLFDPLLTTAMTAEPQALVDAHGGDLFAIAHAALRSGDDRYGVRLAAPLARGADEISAADGSRLRPHASLGVDITNIVWRPRTQPPLERLLQAEPYGRLRDASRPAIARAIRDQQGVAAPWAFVFHANYQFNRAEYTYVDSPSGGARADTRLNDTAAVLGGLQFLARGADPGYFAGVGYTYSAVFRSAGDHVAVAAGGPTKVRANLLRIEGRRVWPGRGIGVSPSYSYDVTSGAKIVEAAAYWRRPDGPFYVGARLGYSTAAQSPLATIFAGVVMPAVAARIGDR